MDFQPLPDLSLFAPGERVLVATSGGADSLALLLALHHQDFDICAAHVNHGLRAEESDGDENFVRELCAQHNIEYAMRRVQVESRGDFFAENAARQSRYAALMEMAREKNCSAIATAHTADDVLETVLLHMARGATIEGWNGIPPIRVLENDLRVVRPILHWTRAQTEAFCRDEKIIWREDSSNSSNRFARNFVRHEIVPLLAKAGDRSREVLARQTSQSATLRREESEFLDELAKETLTDLQLVGQPDALTFDGARWRELPVVLQRRVLRTALRRFDLRDVGLEQLEEMRRHVAAREKRRVWCLARGVRLEWTGAGSGNRIRLWRVGKSVIERAENNAENVQNRRSTLL